MVPHVNRRNTHACNERKEHPKEPAAVTPGSQERGHCARDVLRGKCCSMDASVFLDQINQCRERSTDEFTMPLAGQGEPWALHRKENRNDIPKSVADRRIGHHFPIAFQITLAVENAAKNQQINKIGEVRELHEFSYRGTSQAFQPERRIHPGEPAVKRDELGILPSGIDEVHQFAHLFKAKEKEEMWVPVT